MVPLIISILAWLLLGGVITVTGVLVYFALVWLLGRIGL